MSSAMPAASTSPTSELALTTLTHSSRSLLSSCEASSSKSEKAQPPICTPSSESARDKACAAARADGNLSSAHPSLAASVVVCPNKAAPRRCFASSFSASSCDSSTSTTDSRSLKKSSSSISKTGEPSRSITAGMSSNMSSVNASTASSRREATKWVAQSLRVAGSSSLSLLVPSLVLRVPGEQQPFENMAKCSSYTTSWRRCSHPIASRVPVREMRRGPEKLKA
mmetsp:Transcript_18259/g.49066  ORF Transcript_18259/g.49066 Transcript_18259/m.49066 type:complete len:225 (-) Transcript_18259:7-681(-)